MQNPLKDLRWGVLQKLLKAIIFKALYLDL